MGGRRETGDDADRVALAEALRVFADYITEASDRCTQARWGLIRIRDAAYSAIGFLEAGEPGRAREVLVAALGRSDEELRAYPREAPGPR